MPCESGQNRLRENKGASLKSVGSGGNNGGVCCSSQGAHVVLGLPSDPSDEGSLARHALPIAVLPSPDIGKTTGLHKPLALLF
jgi:hypothetical protein